MPVYKDYDFPIVEYTFDGTFWLITIDDLLGGKFELKVVKELYPGLALEYQGKAFVEDGVIIYTMNSLFFSQIAHDYNISFTNLSLKDAIDCLVYPLMENSIDWGNDVVKLKCFFDPHSENDIYAEFFLNISLKDKVLQIQEKDIEYRKNIIQNFYS